MDGIFGFCLLLLGFISTVHSQYTCYTCSSSSDSRCGDYFQPLVPSSACHGTCMKYRGERWSNGVRTVEVNRLCGETMTEGCQDGVDFNGLSTRRCACNSNLCNHSNKASTHWMLAFLTGSLALFSVS